jgi:hypothetical protein
VLLPARDLSDVIQELLHGHSVEVGVRLDVSRVSYRHFGNVLTDAGIRLSGVGGRSRGGYEHCECDRAGETRDGSLLSPWFVSGPICCAH